MNREEVEKEVNELEQDLAQDTLVDDEAKVNVVTFLTFGFDKCYLSMTNDDLNKRAFSEAKSKFKDFGKFGVPVGYVLHNISSETIKGVRLPKYELKDGEYIGKEIEVDFEPDQYLRMPTRYVILLLMKLNNGLKVGNGKFVPIIDDLQTDDYDAKLSNYIFQDDPQWGGSEYFSSIECIEPVGYGVIRNKKFSIEILEDFYLDIFGNIENIRFHGYNSDFEEKLKVSGIEDPKVQSTAAKFIAYSMG